jgi:hypothetical protein
MTIRDPNLKLTLLQCLWAEGLLPPFDREAFFSDELGQPYDPSAAYNNRVDERVRDALLATSLPTELLAKLKLLQWDGGDDVFHYVWTNWYGDDETFFVTSFDGIEACTGLEEILFGAGFNGTDIAPLGALPNLTELKLWGTKRLPDVRPLLQTPALRKAQISAEDNAENRAAIAALRAKGIEVVASGF